MIQIRNNAVLSAPVAFTSAAIVPFDTVDIDTNSNLALSANTVTMATPGVYNTLCQVTLSNTGSAAVLATITAYADGVAITGASAAVSVEAAGEATVSIPAIVKVISAASGTANVSWYLSGAVNLVNARAQVFKHQ